MFRKLLGVNLISLFFVTIILGGVQAQWRGPNRDGIYLETGILKAWSEAGPKLLWSVEGLGTGYSSVSETKDHIYTTGLINGKDHLFSLTKDGKLLWKKSLGPGHDGDHPGARSTPTVVDSRVYVMSGKGRLVCLDGVNGKEIWSVDLVKEYGAAIPRWGKVESVLIDGDKVFCTPGGQQVSVIALNRNTGKLIWKAKSIGESASYCSPQLIEFSGQRQVVTMTAKSIIGVDAGTGKLMWQHSHTTSWDVHANTPIYDDGYLFCTSGYGTGSVKLKLKSDGQGVEEVWRNKELDSQFDAAVLLDGYVYGSGHHNRGWKCLDWETGALKYSARDLSKGNIIYADGMFICYTDKGRVGLVKPDPDEFKVISRFEVTQGTDPHWAHTVVADGRLFVRHGDALMVYSIAK